MKTFIWKLATIFMLAYLILMLILVFAYLYISENHIAKQAENSISNIHQSLSARLNTNLKDDYNRLAIRIQEIIEAEQDPITELNMQISQIFIGQHNYIAFGSYDPDLEQYVFNGEIYTFSSNLDTDDYEQNVSMYLINGFTIERVDENGSYENLLIFFKVDEVVGYFNAKDYLDPLLDLENNLNVKSIIMAQDKYIFYQQYEQNTTHQFLNYLISANYNFAAFESSIDAGESGMIDLVFFDQDSWILYSPLSSSLSTRQLYLLTVYEKEAVISSFENLNFILIALFFVIFIFFAGSLTLLFRLIQSKNNDIEDARFTHYYAKPYIIRINSRGIIKSYNKSFKKILGDYDVYDKVSDFKIKESFTEDTLIDVIRKQKSFTAVFQLGIMVLYVHFMVIKSGRGYLLIGDDVTNTEGKFDEYRGLAMHHPITRIVNQNQLKIDLKDLFANKTAIHKRNSLVSFSIVSFGTLELFFGNKNTDRVLTMVAQIAIESLDGYPATLYHIDADQFVILFKDIENFNWVSRWLTKMQSLLEQPISIEQNILHIEIKTGIFHIEMDKYAMLSAEQAYENMQLALNHARQSNIHQSFVYDVGLSQVASRDQMMEQDLAIAVQKNEFYMVFQPQYHNLEERIIGFEALIRWRNPKYASESPLKFIKLAEKNNMIIDIGRIAMHETFLVAKQMEPYNVQMSINISPVQILQAGFVNEIITIFEQYDLKKKSISIEITETFLISSLDLVIDKLKILQKYGFDIHLDDFGTGYSSLQYLRDLPISTIKIDRAFIKNMDTDSHSRAIVGMISNLAKSTGLDVIAEGVEDEKINNLVVKAGCYTIQGYLISKPVPKDDAIGLIEAYNIKKDKVVRLQAQPKTRR